MLQPFIPQKAYWLADDGRVFSGPLEQIVDATDQGYSDYVEAGNSVSTWPRDIDGSQTDAMLQDVLEPFGMFVNLINYTADKRWRKEQGGITATAGFPIKTDDRSQAKITGLYTASQEVPAVVTPFSDADNAVRQLDAAAMHQLHVDLLTHINNCFSVSAAMLAGIADGSITTREQVDAAFDAPMTQARKDWMTK